MHEKQYSEQIEFDAYEAQQIGVRGVPFFVFNRKYGISGAQPLEVFTRTLNQAYEEENKVWYFFIVDKICLLLSRVRTSVWIGANALHSKGKWIEYDETGSEKSKIKDLTLKILTV